MWSAQLFLAHGSIQCTFTVTERCALGELQDAVCPLPNNLFAIAVGIMSLRQKNWGSGLYPGSSPMTLSNFFPSGDLVFSSKHVCVDKIVFPIRFPTSFTVLLWLCEFPPHTHTHYHLLKSFIFIPLLNKPSSDSVWCRVPVVTALRRVRWEGCELRASWTTLRAPAKHGLHSGVLHHNLVLFSPSCVEHSLRQERCYRLFSLNIHCTPLLNNNSRKLTKH